MAGIVSEKMIVTSFLILAVCCFRILGRGRVRALFIYAMWGVVAMRLLWPGFLMLPESRFSIMSTGLFRSLSGQLWRPNTTADDLILTSGHFDAGAESSTILAKQMNNETAQTKEAAQASRILQVNQTSLADRQEEDRSFQPKKSCSDELSRLFTAVPWWGYVWGIGSLMMGAALLGIHLRFARHLRQNRKRWTGEDLEAGSRCDPQTGLKTGRLPVYIVEKLPSPFLYGLFCPAIYMTQAWASDPIKRKYILLHEYCHYRHGDPVWTAVRLLCLVLYWFHPLVWVAVFCSQQDCELACDDSVRVRLGEKQKSSYARTLVAILEEGGTGSLPGLFGTTMSGEGRKMSRRLAMLAQKRPQQSWAMAAGCMAAVYLAVAAFTSGCAPTEDSAQTIEIAPGGVRLMADTLYAADLDGDGEKEEFYYKGSGGGNPCFVIEGVNCRENTLWIGNPHMDTDAGESQSREVFYLCDIRENDGQVELAVLDEGPSNDPVTFFLVYTGEEVTKIGQTEGFPFMEESALWNHFCDCGMDGQGHIKGMLRLDILQTWWGSVVWELSETDNRLHPMISENEFYENVNARYYEECGRNQGIREIYSEYPHLIQDMVLYQKPDLTAETFVMTAESHDVFNKIYLTHTDNEHWVRMEDDEGEAGWFYLTGFSDLVTPEGTVSIERYIAGLNNAD